MTSTVQKLLEVPFGSRSLEQKIQVKVIGRPTPDLNITQRISSKNRSFIRKFDPDIYKKHKWLCGCLQRNALFCFPCLLLDGEPLWSKVGFTDMKHLVSRTKKHELSELHMKNVWYVSTFFGKADFTRKSDSARRQDIQLHNKEVRNNRYILNIVINCVRFCGSFDLALRGHDESTSSSNPGIFGGLINFSAELDVAIKQHLEKATGFKGTSIIIQNELLQVMFNVYQQEVSKEIKEADYLSVIVDETSDVSNTFQMSIVFRYIAKGKPVERFWGFLTPSCHDAKTLSSLVLAELGKHLKDDKNKLIAQTYDGAAFISGTSNGVQAIVKKTYRHASYVHCYAHQLNLVMLNAASANKNVHIFFANLQGICAFFSNSSQRTAILDEIVKKRLPRSCPTRWNFDSGVVCTVFEHREDLIETMRKILNETTNVIVTNQATGYIQILTSENFNFWLTLFHKIMPHVDLLFDKFQSTKINPVIANKDIVSFETQIKEIRNTLNGFPYNTNESPPSKRRKIDNCKELVREAKEVCDIIVCQAKERFSFTGHLIAATLFLSEWFNEYIFCFPEKSLQETVKAYPFLNEQKLRTELSVIYRAAAFRPISGLVVFHNCISENEQLSETFSEILKLLKILITIPMTSAEPERSFSTLKRIKAFLRNTTSQERLSALAMLFKERDFIQEIPDFNQRIIDEFAASTHHQIDLKFLQ